MQSWVRRYAQNRTLPMLLNLGIFVLLFAAIGVPSYWGGIAYRSGNITLFVACLCIALVAMLAIFYISVPGWGGRRLQRLGEKLYSNEGRVSLAIAGGTRNRWIALLAAGLAIGVLVSVALGLVGYLPSKYMQPVSALYVVPFLVGLNLLMRPATGYIPLLWPALYTLHAILILAGAPIVFPEPWESLNMLIPVVGYGALSGLIGHVYSRWALRNVRAIVSQQLDRAELVQDEEQQ
jgi:hypothetical protein